MDPGDLAAIEDAVLRLGQKKTAPAWDQDKHSHEGIYDKINRILATYPPYPGTKTWYVDKSGGSDVTGDGSEEHPWATATHALTLAAARDTIIAWGNMQEDSLALTGGQRLFGLGNGLSIIRKTTNTNPGIIVGERVELAGFTIEGIASTGHGIQIIDSDDCHIHDNIIRDITGAYDGIHKSSGGVNHGINIHDNHIIGGAGSGIDMIDVIEAKLKRNICVKNAAEGIILSATCDENVLIENICNDNNEGIELQGDNNHMVGNTMLNNTVANYVDSGINNTRWDLGKKPQWGTAVPGGAMPAGLGVLTTGFTLAPTAPGRVSLTLDLSEYVVGDTVFIYIQVRVAIAFVTVGYISILNGVLTDLVGPSGSMFQGGAIPAGTVTGIQFDLHVDSLTDLRLQLNQTIGGGPRTLWWHYNSIEEI